MRRPFATLCIAGLSLAGCDGESVRISSTTDDSSTAPRR